ncbi:hypothetical protein [Streptomyces bauhiniae]
MTSPIPPGQGWPQEYYGQGYPGQGYYGQGYPEQAYYGQGYGIAGTGPYSGGAPGAATGEAGPSAPPNLPAGEPLPTERHAQALLVALGLPGWETLGKVTEGGINPETRLPKKGTMVQLFDGGEPVNIGNRVSELRMTNRASKASVEEQVVLDRAGFTVTEKGKIEVGQRPDRNAAALKVVFGLRGWETLGTVIEGGINSKTGRPKQDTVVQLFDGGEPVNIGNRVHDLRMTNHASKASVEERAVLEQAEFTVSQKGKIEVGQRPDRNAAALKVVFGLRGWETLGTVTEGGINPDTGLPKKGTMVQLFDGGEPVNIGNRVSDLTRTKQAPKASVEERAVLEQAGFTVTPKKKFGAGLSLQQRRDRNAAALKVVFGLRGWETLGTVTEGGINPDTGLPKKSTVVQLLDGGEPVNIGNRVSSLNPAADPTSKMSDEEKAALEERGFTRDTKGKLVAIGHAVGGGSAVHASGSGAGVVPVFAAQPPAAVAGSSLPWPPSSGPAPGQASGSAYPYGGAPFPAPAYPYPPVQASAQEQWAGQLAGIPVGSVPDPAQAQWLEQLAGIPTHSVPDAGRAQQSPTAPGQPGAAWATAYPPAAWPGTPHHPTTAQAAAHTVPGAPPTQQLPRLNTHTPHRTGSHTHPTLPKPQQPRPGR